MTNSRQNYCKKNEAFKDELWVKVSTSCSEEHWFYAVNERRLFVVTVTVFVIASGFLLFDITSNRSETISRVDKLDQVNSQKMESLQKKFKAFVSATPQISQVTADE